MKDRGYFGKLGERVPVFKALRSRPILADAIRSHGIKYKNWRPFGEGYKWHEIIFMKLAYLVLYQLLGALGKRRLPPSKFSGDAVKEKMGLKK